MKNVDMLAEMIQVCELVYHNYPTSVRHTGNSFIKLCVLCNMLMMMMMMMIIVMVMLNNDNDNCDDDGGDNGLR